MLLDGDKVGRKDTSEASFLLIAKCTGSSCSVQFFKLKLKFCNFENSAK